jgi:hypothetical protein
VKLFFDHITGKLTNYDLIYSLPLAEFENSEYDYAFENGWIPLSWYYTELKNLTWINARNTRLVLNKVEFSKKQKYVLRKKDIKVKILNSFDYDLLSTIYKKYVKYRNFYEEGFENDSEVFEKKDYIDWKYFIYYYKDTPVAFTEFKVFDNKHVLSGQFAWDYENPKLGLGTYATLYEIDWSYKNKYKNYYLSYGYETTSKYKSKYKGFEFWNGKEWVNNKTLYNKLCDNDSSIESIKDLNKYQREYFKLNG